MHSLGQRAIAYTVRNKQLIENDQTKRVILEQTRYEDMETEQERLQAIDSREKVEREKARICREDAKVINRQIAERSRQRMLALEAREQENDAMRILMLQYAEEDRLVQVEKRKEVEKSKKAVAIANDNAIEAKRREKEEERKAMEDILIYQAQLDAKLAKREEEEAAIEKAKKERQLKLLSQQEKALDNASQLDEIRAKRHWEEKERKLRRKEKEERQLKEKSIRELLVFREKQAEERKREKELDALYEQEEIHNQLMYQQKLDERERKEQEYKENQKILFRTRLNSQMDDQRMRKKISEESQSRELSVKQKLIKEEAKLSVIREKMIKDLASQGVDEQYLQEIEALQIGKMLRKC